MEDPAAAAAAFLAQMGAGGGDEAKKEKKKKKNKKKKVRGLGKKPFHLIGSDELRGRGCLLHEKNSSVSKMFRV